MCGISGVYVLSGAVAHREPESIARDMADRIVHRGPDSSGTWSNERADVALGHRRLAIVDLSAAGHQPMASASGRWTITYNGELYNAASLRTSLGLRPEELRGHSDTEILVEAIAAWGVDRTLDAAIGMFAFGAYDRERDELWLARDRFGEKPLLYTTAAGSFGFASELGALRALPGISTEVDADSLVELLERSAVPAPRTILRGVHKLPPGSRAVVRRNGTIDIRRYYDPSTVALTTSVVDRSDDEAIEELEALLSEIVRERMIADVPLGAFLSGGVDSSLVVAMMQRHGVQAQTYTIGFDDEALNEAPAARMIADALGAEHHEWMVTGADALAVVPELGALYDEPFADSSQIPTTLVSRFARRDLTVALSGDGGDELFGGYERYQLLERARRYRQLPSPVRTIGGRALTLLSEDTIDRIASTAAGRFLPGPFRKRTGKRVHTSAALLSAPDDLALYDLIVRPHRNGPGYVRGGSRLARPADQERLGALPPVQLGMAVDTIDYMPNDILVKVDRAAMSTSLETRAPLLDHRLHAFAWSLRPDQRVRGTSGKWIMRETVRRHVPAIADLPKRGFGVPLEAWLRGPLEPWASALLDRTALAAEGVFDADAVGRAWQRHRDGVADHGPELWPVLMFRAWSTSTRAT